MFSNVNGFEEISNNIYVYKNFVSDIELQIINRELEECEWYKLENRQHEQSSEIKSMVPILNRLNSIVPVGCSIVQHTSINRLTYGNSWGVHSDNAEFLKVREQAKMLQTGDNFIEVDNTIYGIVVYFNNFDGGDLVYTRKDFSYHPGPGELVVHGAEEDCEHMVSKVLSDKRYSYSNSIREKLLVPV